MSNDFKTLQRVILIIGDAGLLFCNTYLPDLDGVDTVEQQISIAKQKAGITDNEKYSLQRFEVVRHK